MGTHLGWQILAYLWAVIALWVGGFGLFMAWIAQFRLPIPGGYVPRLRRVLFDVVLVVSGVVALAFASDPAHALQQTGWTVLGLAILCIAVVPIQMIVFVLTRGRREEKFHAWWPRLGVPLGLLIAAATLILIVLDSPPIARILLLGALAVQLLLVAWELWVRKRHESR